MRITNSKGAFFDIAINREFVPKWDRALNFVEMQNGFLNVIDRGALSDRRTVSLVGTYQSTVAKTFFDNISNSIHLDTSETGSLCSVDCSPDEKIFGAEIDYSGTLICNMTEYEEITQSQFNTGRVGFKLELMTFEFLPATTGVYVKNIASYKYDYNKSNLVISRMVSRDSLMKTFSGGSETARVIEIDAIMTDAEIIRFSNYLNTHRTDSVVLVNSSTIPSYASCGFREGWHTVRKYDCIGRVGLQYWKYRIVFVEANFGL